MNTAIPIRKNEELARFKAYYRAERPNARNYLLITVGLNTALRISDILQITWGDVFDFQEDVPRSHLVLTERKTGKASQIYLNQNIVDALEAYRSDRIAERGDVAEGDYLFAGREGRKPLSRVQAYRIVRDAAEHCRISGVVSCHSLRKTFGYRAWKQGVQPVLLMDVYNHSSFRVTQRYLGIEQEDRDEVFRSILL